MLMAQSGPSFADVPLINNSLAIAQLSISPWHSTSVVVVVVVVVVNML